MGLSLWKTWKMRRVTQLLLAGVLLVGCGGTELDNVTTAAPATTAAPTTTVPSTTTVNESVGERNARETAADYLEYSAFSRSGLIDQLEYEGFTTSQAEYGVDAAGY